MDLIIDIGNTRAKYAVFREKELVVLRTTMGFDTSVFHQLLEDYTCERVMVSASGQVSKELFNNFKPLEKVLFFDHETKLPITIAYETPHTLGKDRIAGAVAAWTLFPDQVSLVIDLGTCITTNLVDKNGRFLGGTISPGLAMRAKAMHEYTARLPLVDLVLPEEAIGRNTETSMQNGIIRGVYHELSGYIGNITQLFGVNNIILTGGDAKFFGNLLNFQIFALPNLVLTGLHEILQYND